MKKFLAVLSVAALPCLGIGQTVKAHFAQYLVTSAMSAHPELQKMGLHVVRPGERDDIIVACSVPTKIGKKSSPPDLKVEEFGKPAVKTVAEGSFYDLAFPMEDASKHVIGLIVMEMRFSGASGEDDALLKGEAIRNEIARQLPSRGALFAEAPKSAPLVLLRSTPLPGIVGDFDHFATDEAHDRLYVSAEVHHSIEVFDLKTGEHLQSASGVSVPHTLAFDSETGNLLVADGEDASCRILDGRDLHQVKRIPLAPGPDAGLYDAQKRIFYIGNGGRGAKTDYSFITMIAADTGEEIGQIRVESSNLEAMALDRAANLLYVNMRDENAIGVIDLATKRVRQTWSVPGLNLNTPMALDPDNHRLFVAGRKPGKLFVVDTQSGRLITTLDCVETADDMTFDPKARRIYVTGSGGVTVVRENGPDDYQVITQFGTNGGKTSVLVSELKHFYIIHTKTPEDNAALQVYRVN